MSTTHTPANVSRRGFIAAAGALAAATVAPDVATATPRALPATAPAFPVQYGSGGHPTSNETLAKLARDHGKGEPVMFVDLAAVDQNAKLIANFAQAHHWHVRPALKVFQSPLLCATSCTSCPSRAV